MRRLRLVNVGLGLVALVTLSVAPAGAARLPSVRLPTGMAPSAITTNGTKVWVANTLSSTLTVIDALRARVIGSMRMPAAPLAVYAERTNLWVALSNGTVARYSTKTYRRLSSTARFTLPSAIVASGNRLWVADKAASTVTILNRNSGRFVGVFPSGGTAPVALVVAGSQLIVANTESKDLTAIDLISAEVMGQLTVADHLTAIAASGTRIWYNLPVQNLVGVMESTDMTRRGTHPTAGLHQGGLVVVGNKVFVANGASRLVVALRESSGKIIRGYRTGATPSAMCVAAGRLWVTNFNERSVSGIAL